MRGHDSFLREFYRLSIGKMSYVGWLWVTFTFLLLGCYGKPTDRICWFLKRRRTGEECQGPLRRFDEAIARFVNGDLNCCYLNCYYYHYYYYYCHYYYYYYYYYYY